MDARRLIRRAFILVAAVVTGSPFALGGSAQAAALHPRGAVHERLVAKATGYWVVDASGGVGAAGGAPSWGGLRRSDDLASPVAGMAATPDGGGYWLVTAAGKVFNFGNARLHGRASAAELSHSGRRIVAMAATSDGKGYWLLSAGGRVLPFGDAKHFGSVSATQLAAAGRSLAGITAAPEGGGYWVVATNGRVFCFGDAVCFQRPRAPLPPVVGLAATPSGKGYWLATSTGEVHAFGNAGHDGPVRDAPTQALMVGIAAPANGQGYWLADRQGSTFGAGSASSSAATHLARAAVAIVPDPSPVVPAPAKPAAPGAKLTDGAQEVTTPGDIAVKFALAQVGKPYVYGGAGPYGYDCSGLAMAAWAQAGVALPHRAAEQYYDGTHVPLSQLQPGDLVFWASDPSDPATIYHVAISLGGNMTVQATHTGSTVMELPIWSQDLVPVATRP